MKTEFTITRSTVQCYKLRPTSGLAWADITLDINEKGGRISIASDYGSWQNYWGAAGDFKEFLIRIDMWYTAGKFGCGHWFDFEKTIALYRKLVHERRMEVSKEIYKIMLDELKELDGEGEAGFQGRLMYECPELMKLFDGCPDICHDVLPAFKRFWNEIWPAFIQELKKELTEIPVAS